MPKKNSDVVRTFGINTSSSKTRRQEDLRIMAKLNAVTPYMYRDLHKAGRVLLEQALDAVIAEHGINWTHYLSALANG